MSRMQEALKRAEEQRASRTSTLSDEADRLEASLAAWRSARPAEPVAATNGSQPPWEEELHRCHTLLVSCDARIAQAQQQRASLQVQATEQERVVAQAAAHLGTLQQRVQQAEAGLRSAEADRATHAERLASLRRCQALAQAAAEAEQQLQANTETITRIARVQQRVTEKLSQHQRQAQELRGTTDSLRRQLHDALARAQGVSGSTTNGDGLHE